MMTTHARATHRHKQAHKTHSQLAATHPEWAYTSLRATHVPGSKAFGALRGCLFASNSVTRAARRVVYEAVVLSITLYGCESWSLTEVLLGPRAAAPHARVARARHVRGMCRVTREHMWDHHISTCELSQRLGLDSIDMYIARRQLRWLGPTSRAWTTTGSRAACSPRGCPTGGPSVRRA